MLFIGGAVFFGRGVLGGFEEEVKKGAQIAEADDQEFDPLPKFVKEGIWFLMSNLADVFINLFGYLAGVLINVLIGFAQFNNFVYHPTVTFGWVIVRDVSNMFL